MTAQSPSSGPLVGGPRDPEHDPRASYALEPDYVAGLLDRLAAEGQERTEQISPIDGAPLAYVPTSTRADVDEAFRRARRAQEQWARTPLEQRAEVMLRLHDIVLDRQAEIMDLVCLESGKARKDAFLEVAHIALTARYYGRTAHRHLERRRVPGIFPVLTKVEVNRVPKGVVGVISPWNYPFTMALCDGLPALLAGNGVVSKPDHQTILTALLGARLLDEAGFPEGLWQVVNGGGPEVGGPVVEQADYVCFTGSTTTGRKIAAQCADRLIGCSLELGGKNPMIVLRDADVERAAEGAVRGAFPNAGQLCVSMERLYVADQVYDRFVDRFVARTQAMTLGSSLDWEVDMGTLINRRQLETVQAHVDDAVAKGARVLAGGRARPDLGEFYFEPTILEGVTPDMTCFGQETFGPVIALYRFHDEADVLSRANEGPYGLNASIYSRDGRRAVELGRRIRCGTINVNEPYGAAFGSMEAPMGGMRDSGLGRRQGAEGILRYTEAQSIGHQRLVGLGPSFGLGEETHAKVMTVALRALKKLGRV